MFSHSPSSALPGPLFPTSCTESTVSRTDPTKRHLHDPAHYTVTSAGTKERVLKKIMARRKSQSSFSAAFLRQLKVLVKLPGSPGTEGCATWHLLCPQTTLALFAQNTQRHHAQAAGSAISREVRLAAEHQHAKVSVSKPLSKNKQLPEKTAVDSKLPLQRQSTGCWAVFPRSSSEMEKRLQDRWLLLESGIRAQSGSASGMSSPTTFHHNPPHGWEK